jgi:uncharacterized protein YdaU (DUF1376 family)
MADLQWFPLYPADFLTSRKVRKMSAEQVGIFFLLLMEQFLGGPLPDDEAELCEMARAPWSRTHVILQDHFVLTDEGWINTRLWEEQSRAQSKVESRSRAGKAGAAARWGTKPKPVKDEDGNRNATAIPEDMPSQSEPNGLLEDRTIHDKEESTSEPKKKRKRKDGQENVILIRWELLTPGKRGYKKIKREYFDDVMFVCKDDVPWQENLVIETQEELEAWKS